MQVRDHLVSGLTFNIERCRVCGLLFTNPRPGSLEMKKYYQSPGYISHTDQQNSLHGFLYQTIKKRMAKNKLKLLNKYTQNTEKKLLDYGCGTGDFVLAAHNEGYESIGYEPAKNAMDRARQKGAEVLEDENILFSNHTQYFDVITLWHVLEHIHNVHEKMQVFYKILKPEAWIVIAVPMANSADASVYKEHWAALDVPRHLYHFTPNTLQNLCEANGFQIVERKGLAFDSFYVSLLSEKYKRKPAALPLSLYRGLSSNFKAIRKKTPWSSEIFVCQKRA